MSKILPIDFSGKNAYTLGLTGLQVDLNPSLPAFINYFDFSSNSVTEILEINSWVKINAVTTQGFSRNGLTHVPNNRVRNDGNSKIFKMESILSISSVNNNEIHFAFFKNGNLIPCTEQSIVTSAAGRKSAIPIMCITQINNGDYVEVFVKNATSISDITTDNINVIITEL
jgi:hypothetical protein